MNIYYKLKVTAKLLPRNLKDLTHIENFKHVNCE